LRYAGVISHAKRVCGELYRLSVEAHRGAAPTAAEESTYGREALTRRPDRLTSAQIAAMEFDSTVACSRG
jgi:hypothetical protein